MSSRTWKCVPTATSSAVDISEVPGCPLLWLMSSQWGSQILLQGLVSHHELTPYLSGFNLFLTQWIMAILSKGSKLDNFESHNFLKLSFTNIWGLCSNFVNLSLNQTLVTFLVCVRQIWMNQLILLISLWGVIFLYSKRILLLIYMILQFMWKKDFLLHRIYLWKALQILTYVFDWLYLAQCLTSFSSINHLLHLHAYFLILFHLT